MRTIGLSFAMLGLLIGTEATAQRSSEATTLRGVVFVDSDKDGVRDAGESGLAGVKLSNGRELAVTDADGSYSLLLREGDTVFVIKPPGVDLPRGEDGLPAFWRHHFPQGSPRLRYGGIAATGSFNGDFPVYLVARESKQGLDVLLFGDPQPKRSRDVDYFERDIVAPILRAVSEGAGPAHLQNADGELGLTLGDVVNDDLSLFPAIKRVTTRLGLPWLHLPGNHDIDFDATRDEDSLLSYRAAFGPDSYAWEERQANFILLDDTVYRPGSSPAYIGGLREDQFAFLTAYLATLPRDKRLIVAAHIPFHDATLASETFRRADRERLFALLQPFQKVLLLSSHAHAQRHYFHAAPDGWNGASPLHEYVVGTACGGFWSGLEDAEGIPDARMNDGTPNGFGRLSIGAADYRLRWYVARDESDTRIALHAPRVLRRGAYPAFSVSANVFMGMDDTRVEYRIDASAWRAMTRVVSLDPALVAINSADDAAVKLRSYDRAVLAEPSTHVWRGALPTDLAVGEHQVDVRAFDRWDGELRASIAYRLDEFVDTP